MKLILFYTSGRNNEINISLNYVCSLDVYSRKKVIYFEFPNQSKSEFSSILIICAE